MGSHRTVGRYSFFPLIWQKSGHLQQHPIMQGVASFLNKKSGYLDPKATRPRAIGKSQLDDREIDSEGCCVRFALHNSMVKMMHSKVGRYNVVSLFSVFSFPRASPTRASYGL